MHELASSYRIPTMLWPVFRNEIGEITQFRHNPNCIPGDYDQQLIGYVIHSPNIGQVYVGVLCGRLLSRSGEVHSNAPFVCAVLDDDDEIECSSVRRESESKAFEYLQNLVKRDRYRIIKAQMEQQMCSLLD